MNRYYSVAALSVGVIADVLPAFTPCKRMIIFDPLAMGTPLTMFPNFIVAVRIYAIYARNKYLAAAMIIYLIAETGVALWIYLTPSVHSIQLPGPESITDSLTLHQCLADDSQNLSSLQAASFQIMQTIFDSCALALVLFKTYREFMGPKPYRGLRSIIASHGLIYYLVVFSTNISWALMVLLATPDLKYTMAVPTIALAPLAANKLTLSLRRYGCMSADASS
ncbi:hypothetical protein SCHPADRAFT_429220 [Schizopora paradoxa]|uniref:Uncharacterized protein n=1 Tax=Schizopora paradoxa TaxID=27342 RepID=A0A0H2RK80_9AGAM|nr:hypothetical protein SCHPADRAFT_429220 [Schizopora paradoxa]